jgi:histidinol dehydrogenase
MPLKLNNAEAGFAAAFDGFLNLKRDQDADVDRVVAQIIQRVRDEGDAALVELTERFDRIALQAEDLRIPESAFEAAAEQVPAETLRALEVAAARIADFHERQKPEDLSYRDAEGNLLGYRWTAVDAAGLYVPGGTAAYPSSVLMNAIPARVAGVERRVMVVPTPDGVLNPLVLLAAKLAGVTEAYRIGGAQAVAALAYGTASIAPVDKIVGPGNAFVAAAKRRVFGQVGIDSIAGPSEILVVADAANDPAWIAADLLSQAEHDAVAQSVLITDDAAFAEQVERAIDLHLQSLPRSDIAAGSWRDYGAVILVESLEDQAPALVDRIAPEHLELAVDAPQELAAKIRHAGAIFMGRYTPEVIGDYLAGPNHVLPTSRTARFSSGLSVLDFMKRSSLVAFSPEGLEAVGSEAVTLAKAEGLDAHALSVAIRLAGRDGKG